MLLKTKIFLTIASVFVLHFLVVAYISRSQIEQNVVEEVQDQARIVRGMLMALRRVYQDEFLSHDIPINEQTLELLPAHAISQLSGEFRNWVSNGVTFNNVSEQPRNPDNQADGVEQDAIDYFAAHPQQQERLVPFTNEAGEAYYHYAQPIRVESQCLTCHGSRDQVPAEIRNRYTTGFDFKLGELRGILSIKLPAKLFDERMAAELKQSTLTHLAGILFAFLLLTVLLNKTVVKPLVRLQHVTRQLYHGDFSVRAGVRRGSDEIARVARMFDKMVVRLAKRDRELQLQRSLFAALAETNKLISRVNTREKLFEQVCRLSLDYAEVSLAWICLVNRDKTLLKSVASAGDAAMWRSLSVPLDASSGRQYSANPLVRAISRRRVVVVDDLEKSHGALEPIDGIDVKQIRSAAFFPIIVQGKAVGSFNLYAEGKRFFTPQTQELLEEIAADIAFAMGNLRRKEVFEQTQIELEESTRQLSRTNSHLRSLLESTGEGVYAEDRLGYCTFVNQAACEMLGFTKQELLGKPIIELLQPGSTEHEIDFTQTYPVTHDWVTGDEVQRERLTRKDGSRFPVEAVTRPIIENDQTQGAVTVFRDITERLTWSQKMHDLANHDHLTHLLNRFAFEQLLQSALDQIKRDGSESVLCYMDLDQFKVVNDTCGHAAGDNMLKLLAQTLSRSVKATDKLARLGGDEFGLLLTSCTLDEASQVANKLCDLVREFRFNWRGQSFTTGINIGVVGLTPDSAEVSSLLSTADAACYLAKEMGRNSVYVSRAQDQALGNWRGEVQWASDLQLAMQERRLVLHCQTIERLDRRTSDGSRFELLLRMTDENGDAISPQSFIPSAERYDQMVKLDRWVINQAFQWLADDRQRVTGVGLCAINLSAQSLLDNSLYEYIINELRRHELPAHKICFEISESAVVSRLDHCVVSMGLLKELGFRFALDDFGVGMSSFSYLKQLPVDFLKIDGSIVMSILEDPVNRSMVESINNIAHLMGLQTIAKCVENDWIRFELKKIGVDYVQGFGVARPEPLLNVIAL